MIVVRCEYCDSLDIKVEYSETELVFDGLIKTIRRELPVRELQKQIQERRGA
jgi:hypothetical protein